MSERKMTEAQVAAFCLGLPGVQEDYKWGGVRVFSVAGNKMFAVMDLAGAGLSFKVDTELFLGYVDRRGATGAVPGAGTLDQCGAALCDGAWGTGRVAAPLAPTGGAAIAQARTGRVAALRPMAFAGKAGP